MTQALLQRKSLWERVTTTVAQIAVNAVRTIPKWVEIEPHFAFVGPVPTLVFVKANEDEGVVVTYGQFKRRDRRCKALCKKMFSTFEEKQTDVNIALRLFELAVQDRYDKAVIVSGDTDLLPAVKAVQRTFPAKKIGVLIPVWTCIRGLQETSGFPSQNESGSLARPRDSTTP